MKPRRAEKNFLEADGQTAESCRFFVVPIPHERTTSYMKGTRFGPAAVIAASAQLEYYDEETGGETFREGVFTLEPLKIPKSEKIFFEKIGELAESLISTFRGIPFFIGGEHAISQALIPPFAGKYRNLSVLHFDAHADLRKAYEGNPRNHACAMRPISKICKVLQIGIRSVAPEEKKLINHGNVRTYLMHENPDFERLAENVISNLAENVYISIDVDGFDPSVMPGTGTPQPGGFSWREALGIFRKVCLAKNVVGADLVEVRPLKDNPITEFAAAKLIYRLMGYISLKKS